MTVIRVTCSNLFARLPPLKRILCIAAVPKPHTNKFGNNGHTSNVYRIGMAISDSYLANAAPILTADNLVIPHTHPLNQTKETPRSMHIIDAIENLEFFNEIGGIAVALPLFLHIEDDKVKAKRERSILREIIGSKWRKQPLLLADIDIQPSLKEVNERIGDSPEMWEEVIASKDIQTLIEADLLVSSRYHPSIHAAISLNFTLLEQTGGWQNNTFG